jgi:hypothetical protein
LDWRNNDGTFYLLFIDDLIDNTIIENVFDKTNKMTNNKVTLFKFGLTLETVFFYLAMLCSVVITMQIQNWTLTLISAHFFWFGTACLRLIHRIEVQRKKLRI